MKTMPNYPLEVHDLFIPAVPTGADDPPADERRAAEERMAAAVQRMRAEIAAMQATRTDKPQEP